MQGPSQFDEGWWAIRLMDKILHDLNKDSKLWELWYIPYNGYCRILSINSIVVCLDSGTLRSNIGNHPGLSFGALNRTLKEGPLKA